VSKKEKRPQLPAVIKLRIPDAKLPVEYEAACKALATVTTIDEAKFWTDKAEALAAWAKIYKSDRAAVEAKRLKLHAYRRMGELAAELRPSPVRDGHTKGPASLLMERYGFTRARATTARRLANMSDAEFADLSEGAAPLYRVLQNGAASSGAWHTLMYSSGGGLCHSRSFCRRFSASELARGLKLDEVDKARELVRELSDWLDEFEQHLPKPAKRK
jgi:hypothetical protein